MLYQCKYMNLNRTTHYRIPFVCLNLEKSPLICLFIYIYMYICLYILIDITRFKERGSIWKQIWQLEIHEGKKKAGNRCHIYQFTEISLYLWIYQVLHFVLFQLLLEFSSP